MGERRVPCVVCLGYFDGVHRGHLALLSAARREADRRGCPVVVHTFDCAPGSKGPQLTTLEEREQLLLAAGADRVAVSHFDEEMRHMPGDVFFRDVVVERLNACHVVCGDDHRFGYLGGWGVEELRALCESFGVGLTVVPPVTLENGQRVSSTAIRAALARGDARAAEEMLGRKLAPGPAARQDLPKTLDSSPKIE